MRRIGLIAAGGLLGLMAANAWAAERKFMVTGFDEIKVAGPFEVVVSVGKGQSVRAVGAQNDLDRLKVEVSGGELRIGTRERGWSDWSTTQPVRIWVTVPSLKAASIAGSGDLRIDRVKADGFSGSVAGSGDLAIAELNATAAKFSIAGSGDLMASGTCQDASVSVSGSGKANIGELRCRSLSGSVTGSGTINANATRTAKLSVVGSGDVTVTGGAKCDVSKMGSGSVRCG